MKFIFLLIITFLSIAAYGQGDSLELLKPVRKQLEAYNNRDIEAFANAYADTVKVYRFPDQLLYKGNDVLFNRYKSMFARLPDLHAEVTSRMIVGNTVIDREVVTLQKDKPKINAIAIYKIHNGKITEVYFIGEE